MQKRDGLSIFDICLSLIFTCYYQSAVSGRKTGHVALFSTDLEIFLIFSKILSLFFSYVVTQTRPAAKQLNRSETREATYIQSLLYQKSSPSLLVVNKTFTKVLNCFITLFLRLYLEIAFSIASNRARIHDQDQIISTGKNNFYLSMTF